MKPNLLLIHGWAFDGSCFERLSPLLRNKFTIHTPDLEPIWENRIAALEELICGTEGVWYGCGWSMGFLITSELQRRGLLAKNCGICALPAFNRKNGLPEKTIEEMLGGLKVNPGKVLRRFSLLTAHPGRPIRQAAGGGPDYLFSSLTYLRDGGSTGRDTPTALLLAGEDAVLRPEAAEAFGELSPTIVPETGHDLPLSRPETVAAWLSETFL